MSNSFMEAAASFYNKHQPIRKNGWRSFSEKNVLFHHRGTFRFEYKGISFSWIGGQECQGEFYLTFSLPDSFQKTGTLIGGLRDLVEKHHPQYRVSDIGSISYEEEQYEPVLQYLVKEGIPPYRRSSGRIHEKDLVFVFPYALLNILLPYYIREKITNLEQIRRVPQNPFF